MSKHLGLTREDMTREADFEVYSEGFDRTMKFWFWGTFEFMVYQTSKPQTELSETKIIDGELYYKHSYMGDEWSKWEVGNHDNILHARNEAIKIIEDTLLGEDNE